MLNPIQTTVTDVLPSLPGPEMVAAAIIFFLAGMAVPTRYGFERIEGFGRLLASKLPYKAPPGMNEDEAMLYAHTAREHDHSDDFETRAAGETTEGEKEGGGN